MSSVKKLFFREASLLNTVLRFLSHGVCLAALFAVTLSAAAQPQAGLGVIEGKVQSSNGSEAGVWVIAETDDLPTHFIKIVVTDDGGRFLLPELPEAQYKVWVRGYGLVDSEASLFTQWRRCYFKYFCCRLCGRSGSSLSCQLLVFLARSS